MNDRVNLSVDANTKAEWQAYVNEHPEVASLSQLVRMAVSSEIRNHNQEHEESDEIADTLSSILDEQRNTHNRLESIENRLTRVEERITPDRRSKELHSRLFDVLPSGPRLDEYDEGNVPPYLPEDVEGSPEANSGYVEHIAAALEEDTLKVERAIESLSDQTARVRMRTDEEGTERYYLDE